MLFSPDGQRIVTKSIDGTARIWDAAMGKQIVVLDGFLMSLSPDGQLIVTAPLDNTARISDVSRSEPIARERSIVLTAVLARGVGWRTDAESADLLMQDAPKDLYAKARMRLLDPQKVSPEEIARREQLLEQTIADLRAPLHPNCYLSPTQFAEKFGLPPPAIAAEGAAAAVPAASPEPAIAAKPAGSTAKPAPQ